MWYLRKSWISCEQFGSVSTCSCLKYIKCFVQSLGNGREDKNGEKNVPIYFAKIELFFNFETKSNLSTLVFIFSTISQILNRTFYVF